jgi:hypothetical protein
MITFRIQNNTDAVDIEQKCLGIDVWVPGDSLSLLNTNRGLHTQIKHNGNKDTFNAACELQKLLSAAPEMLEFIRRIVTEQADLGDHGDAEIISEGERILSKIGA